MKNPLLLLLCSAAALLAGCRGDLCTLQVTLDDADGTLDTLRLIGFADDRLIASAPVRKGSARLVAPCDDWFAARLTDGRRTLALLLPERGEANAAPDGRGGYRIGGTPLNDRLTRLHEELDSLRTALYAAPPDAEEEVRNARRALIGKAVADNRDNALGAWLCAARLREGAGTDDAARLLGLLDPALRRLVAHSARYAPAATGNEAPPLNLPDTTGRRRTLCEALRPDGKTLLLFWATWDTEGRQLLARLERHLDGHPERGLYAVSLDNDSAAWRRSLGRDTGKALHVLGTLDGRSPAAESYGIRTLPTLLLLTPDGHIERRADGSAACRRLAAALPASAERPGR